MKRRATSILFAVATSGVAATVATAEPTEPANQPTPTAEQPRRLATGAPACGNVMFKSYTPPPPCMTTETKVVLAGAREDLAGFRRALAVFEGFLRAPLTVAEARRPGS